MERPLIEFKQVSKSFSGRTILDRVDLSIREGEITTIIGKSGVGKSVTLKQIVGLLEPDAGEILYSGRQIRDMSRKERRQLRERVSYMFQHNALFDSMTVFENIALPLVEKTRLTGKTIRERVKGMVDQLELSEVINSYPSQISGGMQKRVALARALITEPSIVLFDEPTTGLDPIRKNMVLGMIAHYQKTFGFTAIVVSHDIPDLFFISNRIAIIYDGRMIFQGSLDELESLDHPIIEEFIDSMRSLKDELTGLQTRRSFERQYEHAFGPIRASEAFTVIIFSVDLSDSDPKAQAVMKILAASIDKHIGVWSISSRFSPCQILSVLPHTDQERAEAFLTDLAEDLKANRDDQEGIGRNTVILAGLAQGEHGQDLADLVELAQANQEVLLAGAAEASASL
jgi:phospholipid/cholesterol/gamma-HCH transport system ATP-binding protein